MSDYWIVELESDVWFSEGKGDPPRTLDRRNALKLSSMKAAQRIIAVARHFRPFRKAKIHHITEISDD